MDANPGRRASAIREDRIEQDTRRLVRGSTIREFNEKALGNDREKEVS